MWQRTLKFTTLLAFGLTSLSCRPTSTDIRRQSQDSTISAIALNLPDKTKIKAGPVERLTGFHLTIRAIPEGCNSFKNIDNVGRWTETSLSQKIFQGCDYEVILSVGELKDASASPLELSLAFYSNESSQQSDRILRKDDVKGKSAVRMKLNLSVTESGKAVGFGGEDVSTNPSGTGSLNLVEIEPDADLHNIFDGISWRINGGYIEVDGGERPMGSTSLVAPCLEQFGESFSRWADDQQIKVAQLYATAITESGCRNLQGSSDNLSAGVMQVTGSTGNSILQKIGRAFGSSEECKEAMISDPDLSIELASRYVAAPDQIERNRFEPIAGQSSQKGPALDPPKVAAGYNAGSLRESSANRWHLVVTGNHIDRYVAAYNAFVAYLKKDSVEESVSLWLTAGNLNLKSSARLPASVTDINELDAYTNQAENGDAIFVGNFESRDGDFYYFVNGTWRGSMENW